MIKLNDFWSDTWINTWWTIIIVITLILGLIALLGKKTRKAKNKRIIPEPPNILKFKVKSLIDDVPCKESEMLFEDGDLEYYKSIASTASLSPDSPEKIVFQQNINDQTNAFQQNTHDQMYNEIMNNILLEPDNNANDETIMNNMHNYLFDDNGNENNIDNTFVLINDPDSQNVHDSEVGKAVRKIFSDIDIISKDDFQTDNLMTEIREYINEKNIDKETSDKISIVLETIKGRNSVITNINNATELELLASVWNDAKSKSESSASNIKDMLLTQLTDTNENGNVLCPSGFVNRIATALVVETPEKFPKTKTMINGEMLESAAHIRKELEKDTTYTAMSEDVQNIEFKDKLNKKIENDYDGILSKDEIKDIIAPWIDHV